MVDNNISITDLDLSDNNLGGQQARHLLSVFPTMIQQLSRSANRSGIGPLTDPAQSNVEPSKQTAVARKVRGYQNFSRHRVLPPRHSRPWKGCIAEPEPAEQRQFISPPTPGTRLAFSQLAMVLQALAINSSLLTLDVGWNSLCEDQVRRDMRTQPREGHAHLKTSC